jgi:hypothetical protein
MEFDEDLMWECMTLVIEKIAEPYICASRMHLTAIKEKYQHEKYLSAASLVRPPSTMYVAIKKVDDKEKVIIDHI